jgi:hypothetical protein
MKVRDVIKAMEKDGWVLDRTRGDHRQYIHPAKSGGRDSDGSRSPWRRHSKLDT